MKTQRRMTSMALLALAGVMGMGQLAARSVAQPAQATVAWGEARDGLRIGLSSQRTAVPAGAKFVQLGVHYQNVGEKAVEVPVHRHPEVNTSVMMFAGEFRDKMFTIGNVVDRLATAPMKYRTLQPEESLSETVMLHVGKHGSGNGYYGIPALAEGESFSLQVGLCDAVDPHGFETWKAEATQKSGTIKVTAVADPTAVRLKELKADIESLELRLQYYGEEPGGGLMPGLILHTAGIDYFLLPGWQALRLKEAEALKLVEGLAAEGVLRQAVAGEVKLAEVGYALHLQTNGVTLYEVLGHPSHIKVLEKPPHQISGANGTELLRSRLTTIRGLLEGEPRKALETFLEGISK